MALMPPEDRVPVETSSPVVGSLTKFLLGSAILMYAPMYHMQTEPPAAPIMRRLRRPILSTRMKSQIRAPRVLITPKMPVVRREVDVPTMPIDLKMVGE